MIYAAAVKFMHSGIHPDGTDEAKRYKAVEQRTLASPLRILTVSDPRRYGSSPLRTATRRRRNPA